MSLFQRMEQKLERAVVGAFARAFRAEVQPLEIASAIRRAMDDRAAVLGRGRTIVPNLFTIELSPGDFERLAEFDEELEQELIAAAEEHADSQRYQPGGPVQVALEADEELETGVFRVRPATVRRPAEADDAQRPTARPPVSSTRDDDYDADYPDELEGTDPDNPYDEYSMEMPAVDPLREPEDLAAAAPAPAPARRPTTPPAPPRPASFADRPWLDVDGERYPLIGPMTVLGRDDSADVILDDPGISRRHCEIRITNDGPRYVASLRDLGSTNGTFVNSDRTTGQRLQDGDRITVGRTTVTFRTGRR
ncbi:FhaA domain-containing protein [Janibacter sp. G56]|uniref:FhaA domain-containing protein n=1 Tax=Janibacter sp. G56 TaxID=3418717 RepID=UPI003D0568A1